MAQTDINSAAEMIFVASIIDPSGNLCGSVQTADSALNTANEQAPSSTQVLATLLLVVSSFPRYNQSNAALHFDNVSAAAPLLPEPTQRRNNEAERK